jgi:hypothetical protein
MTFSFMDSSIVFLQTLEEIFGNFPYTLDVPGMIYFIYLLFSSPGPKVHVNYCHHLASVVCRLSFHISSFFSETTGPIGTKLSRNVPWMVLYKVTVFRSSRIFNMAVRANNML